MPEKNRQLLKLPASLHGTPVYLQRSKQRRTVSITIEPTGNVRLLAPYYVNTIFIHQFMEEKAAWILKHLNEIKIRQRDIPEQSFENGSTICFMGEPFCLFLKFKDDIKRARAFFESGQLFVYLPGNYRCQDAKDVVRTELLKLFRQEALYLLEERTKFFADRYGFSQYVVKVREQKRIWGSCDRLNVLRYNWRLILAPLDVIDYVVVHELCHTRVRNHSAKFWAQVQSILPDFKERRKLLKNEGHTYCF